MDEYPAILLQLLGSFRLLVAIEVGPFKLKSSIWPPALPPSMFR